MQVIAITDIGNGRKINEDDYFFTKEQVGDLPNLFMVADGLGGHKAGEVASRMAIDSVVRYCLETIQPNLGQLLKEAYLEANKSVFEYGQKNNNCYEMGTTLVALSVLENQYLIANIGDSRAYLLRDGELKRITKDHSPVQELQELGVITEEEAYHHENRNLISKAIGMEHEIDADIYQVEAKENDILLLCTDGLSNFLRRSEMQEILKQEKSLEELANDLLKEALANESTDNITILLVSNPTEREDNLC